MKYLFFIIFSFIIFSNATYAQVANVPTRAQILEAAAKNGISEEEINSVNISEEEFVRKLIIKGVDLQNQAAVEKAALEIFNEEIAKKKLEIKKDAVLEQQKDDIEENIDEATEKKVDATEKIVAEEKAKVINKLDNPIDAKEAIETVLEELNVSDDDGDFVYGQQLFSKIALYIDPKNIKPKDSYVLGIGDELFVSAYNESRNASFEFQVNKDGYIDKEQFLPRLYVKGLTFGEVKKLLKNSLSRRFNLSSTNISIGMSYARTLNIDLLGEVKKGGNYTIPGINTAINALVACEGLTEIGSVRKIKLIREGNPDRILDIYKYMENPKEAENFYLEDNDVIIVPTIGRTVSIEGSVYKPYRFELIASENLKKVLEYAGGLTATAYKKVIQIRRIENESYTYINVNLSALLNSGGDFTLKNGDLITIRAINSLNRNYVKVSGAFLYPNEYGYEEGRKLDYYVSKGVLMEEARVDTAYVVRTNLDGTTSYIRINVDSILSFPTSKSNFALQPRDEIIVGKISTYKDKYDVSITGEVRKGATTVPYDDKLTVKDLIYLGGGLKDNSASGAYLIRTNVDNSKSYIQINLDDFMDGNSNTNETFKIEPRDQIKIFDIKAQVDNYTINISGEVRSPGELSFDESLTVRDLIYFANGLKPEAMSIAYLIRTNVEDRTKEYLKVNLTEILDESNPLNDQIKLQPLDVLKVFDKNKYLDDYQILVRGAVRNPGEFPYDETLTLEDVLYFANGLKPEASNSRVEVSRVVIMPNGEETEVISAAFEVNDDLSIKGGNYPLERYDQIYVRLASDFELQRNVRIEGEVKYMGHYPLIGKGKEEKISDIIKRAGGLTDEAFPKGATLLRQEDGVGIVLLDLEDVLKKPQRSEFNYTLRDGDLIIIPKATELIAIRGAVENPQVLTEGKINVPYTNGRRANYYVRKYGDGVNRTREGRRRYIHVEYANGDREKTIDLGLVKIYPKVEQGSSVVVGVKPKVEDEITKERKDINWEDVISDALTKLTAVVTLYVLLQNAFK